MEFPLTLKQSDLLYLISISNNLDCFNIGFQILSSSVPNDSISFFPNPIYHQGDIFVEQLYQNIKDVRFEIYDLNGRYFKRKYINI